MDRYEVTYKGRLLEFTLVVEVPTGTEHPDTAVMHKVALLTFIPVPALWKRCKVVKQ